MRIHFISLFPETIRPFLEASMMARAAKAGAVEFGLVDPRRFCTDRHQKVDDTPYGGHPGMLIKAEPVYQAVQSLALVESSAVVLTSPSARPFGQQDARELTGFEELVFLCGHYEGFDHRLEEEVVSQAYSIGDFVLTNGELPAVCMADAVVRLLPGVLGDPQSLTEDSYTDGLLSAPNYTRPEEWRGRKVPEVLLSGNHKEIAKWRRRISLQQTRLLRPDLLARAQLYKGDLDLLEE